MVWVLAIALGPLLHSHDQQRFTVSEVAADWYEVMIPHTWTGGKMHLGLAHTFWGLWPPSPTIPPKVSMSTIAINRQAVLKTLQDYSPVLS